MSHEQKKLIIIGGGAMGVSLLYHLAKLGWQDLLLIEKNELTAGSTWHAAGLCTHFAHSPTIMKMRAYSARMYGGELEKDTGVPVSFHRCGALRITRSADRMDEFYQVQGLGEFLGHPFHVFNAEELAELYPLAELGDGLLGGIHEPNDGYVDPTQATHSMAAGARQRGAKIQRHTSVTATEQTAEGRWIVHTDKGSYETEHLVNAAGTWGHDIGEMMGLDLPMVPMLHQYLVTDRVEEVAAQPSELPMIRDPEESWYLRQERDGYIFGPYEQNAPPWSVDGVPPEFGMELLPPDLEAMMPIMEMAMARVPALANAGIKTIVNGPITFTPDAAPLIGPAFGVKNAWLLTGSSMGVMEGCGAGHFLAQWMHDGAPPYDAHAVDPRRFGSYADRSFRLEKAIEGFGRQFAIHYPNEHLPAGRNRRLSTLHDRWTEQHAVMGAAYGWERPEYFSTSENTRTHQLSFKHTNAFEEVARECRIASESLAFCDLSLFCKIRLSGQDAQAFLNTLGSNRAPQKDGRVALLHVLTPHGGVEMEFTVTRLSSQDYYLTCAAAAEQRALQLLQDRSSGLELEIKNLSDDWGILGVFGPRAPEVMQSLSERDLSQAAFPWLSAQSMTLAGQPLLALRLSYIGEAGFELHLPREALATLHQTLLEKAQALDIDTAPIGLLAVNAMRLEKGYPAWGMDLTTERTPIESAMGHCVKTDNRDFIGRDALLARQTPEAWHLTLLEIDNPEGPAYGAQPVYCGERVVGIVTSGAYGHRVQKNLAFAYFRETPTDEALSVKVLGKHYPAKCLERAPYDPNNARLKA